MKQLYSDILLALFFVIVVLWQILLPGYVFFLDFVVGPQPLLHYENVADYMSAPMNLLMYSMGALFPGWVVQKVILFALVFCLLYLPLRFALTMTKARYAYALLIAVNPFVYERLLAGHWRVVAGYILLVPLLFFLLRGAQACSYRNLISAAVTLIIIGCISIHFFVMGILITGLWALWVGARSFFQKDDTTLYIFMKKGIVVGVGMLIVSLYWTLPYIMRGDTTVETFDVRDREAFVTAEGENIGVIPNTLLMHGFWGERHAWRAGFVLPKDNALMFGIGYSFFLVFVLIGAFNKSKTQSSKSKNQRIKTEKSHPSHLSFLTSLLLLSLILSLGVSETIFQPLSLWLFDHVPFWSGFRDTQKWSGVAILISAALFASGVAYVGERVKGHTRNQVFFVGTLLVPLLMTPMFFFGFAGQLQAQDYPLPWHAADDVLRSERAELRAEGRRCAALFLPWHQYYRTSFSGGALHVNPAKRFFSCDIIASKNTDLNGIAPRPQDADIYARIDALVRINSSEHVDETLHALSALGITHIIETKDFVGQDIYRYPFLRRTDLQRVFESEEIMVYALPSEGEL